VLRGSQKQSNYDTDTIQQTVTSLNQLNLINRVLIDCSHGNSQKDHTQQLTVLRYLSNQLQQGNKHFFGVMLESHLTAGKQTWTPNHPINHEQSITDACIGWEETEMALDELSQSVQIQRKNMLSYT
jgi:3-deoxy-7-phosphoheptulonate synthase